jgi:hypothetical protein
MYRNWSAGISGQGVVYRWLVGETTAFRPKQLPPLHPSATPGAALPDEDDHDEEDEDDLLTNPRVRARSRSGCQHKTRRR